MLEVPLMYIQPQNSSKYAGFQFMFLLTSVTIYQSSTKLIVVLIFLFAVMYVSISGVYLLTISALDLLHNDCFLLPVLHLVLEWRFDALWIFHNTEWNVLVSAWSIIFFPPPWFCSRRFVSSSHWNMPRCVQMNWATLGSEQLRLPPLDWSFCWFWGTLHDM